MYNQELTIEEIHEGTLDVVRKIIEICNFLGIDYVVYYGSLIGAVRHKGFIPWDDDFDIALKRPDFDRFIEYCINNEQVLYPFRIIDKNNSKDYPFNIPRFCDLRYRMETERVPDSGMGLFVDIYPLDGYGSNIKKAKSRIGRKKKIYAICLDIARHKKMPNTRKGLKYKCIIFILYLYARHKKPSYFLEKYDKLGKIYDFEKSEYIDCAVWGSGFVPIKKRWLEESINTQFETLNLRIPKEYDSILKILYGDYMQLPPKEKQHPTHEYKLYRK